MPRHHGGQRIVVVREQLGEVRQPDGWQWASSAVVLARRRILAQSVEHWSHAAKLQYAQASSASSFCWTARDSREEILQLSATTARDVRPSLPDATNEVRMMR